jgi:uncharacterized membrane protein YuzA (DUF378 family)
MIKTDCNKWRVRLSVIVPALFLLVGLAAVWMFAEQPDANQDNSQKQATPTARP